MGHCVIYEIISVAIVGAVARCTYNFSNPITYLMKNNGCMNRCSWVLEYFWKFCKSNNTENWATTLFCIFENVLGMINW